MTAYVLLLVALVVGLAAVGAALAAAILSRRLRDPDPVLVRTNVRGVEVPVVLGDAFAAGAMGGVVVLAVISFTAGDIAGEIVAVGSVIAVMWAAGAWDDRKGDERPRGFKGHLGALRSGAVTGGLVKIGAGLVAGLVTAATIPDRGASPAAHIVETILLVGLSANLINLLDRAPGRAGKAAILIGIPLASFGEAGWAITSAAALGAVLFCLLPDLRERAMLGDAGANPLGAVLGVGLAASLGETHRVIAIVVLLGLNLASEKWSFSKAIEATPPLRWLDGLGRAGQPLSK